jgi:hypothetical protein
MSQGKGTTKGKIKREERRGKRIQKGVLWDITSIFIFLKVDAH